MPKDNEVDEKAQTEELIRRLREVLGANGSGPETTLLARAQYHAATVAELRDQLERVMAYAAHQEEVVAARNLDWYTEKQRADAAERRVAALQECAVRYLKWLRVSKPEAALEHDLHDAGMCGDKTLTGADPT